MSRFAIECVNVQKTYRGKPAVEALRGIDLQVHTGECFGVLGPNGAGKTTAIEIMEGLLPASSGQVCILGKRWDDGADAILQQIGITLQETRFSDKLTVFETLTLFRSFYRRGISAAAAMSRVALDEKAEAWVKNLSGGQQQRLAVAVALVGDPALLFLDEPTTGLDPQSRRHLWDIITDFRDKGRTVLLTTHYMEEAERLCDRVAIIDRGRIIALGTPQELIAGIGGQHVVEFSCVPAVPHTPRNQDWCDLPGVTSVAEDEGRLQLTVTEPHVVIPAVLDQVERQGRKLASLTTRQASLEDVFVKMTGRHLADEEQMEAC